MTRIGTFRHCPVCGSDAVSQLLSSDVGEQEATVAVRCGACATWRARTVRWKRARALEHRLQRMTRRHRYAIEDDLRHLRRAGLQSADFLLDPEIPRAMP
jgi:hypothetical protein